MCRQFFFFFFFFFLGWKKIEGERAVHEAQKTRDLTRTQLLWKKERERRIGGGNSETGEGGGGREGMRRIDFNCLKDKATDPRIIQRIAFQFQSKVRLLILPQCFH